jgi:tetratricopeptide (TPR) repeat protein
MVGQILGAGEAEAELQKLIIEKTEGVPFFLEEFIRSLQRLDVIKKSGKRVFLQRDPRSVEIPSTIQDIIMAKVDSLCQRAKELLQAGAAIEREFSYILIRQIAGIEESDLLSYLEDLKAVELIYERDLYPNNTYVFRHAMTRDVIYDSILEKTRKQLHERIGIAIEQLWKDNRQEHYAELVRHFAASENLWKTAEYAELACIKAEKNLFLAEAVFFAEKWVYALENLPRSQRLQKEMVKARTALGFLHFRMSNMADAKESIQSISEDFMHQNMETEQGQAWVIKGSYKYMVEENFPESINYLEKAISITEKTGDVITSVYAHYMLGLVLAFNCEFEKAIKYFDLLLGLSEALAYKWRIAVMKSNLSIYGYNYHGMVAEGFENSQDAVSIAEDSGDIYSKAMAYTSHGVSCYYKGLLKEAMGFLQKATDYTQKINVTAHKALAHEYLGHICLHQGKYRQARQQYEKTIHIRETSRLFPSSANLNRIALALAGCLGGEGIQETDLLYKYALENRVKIYEGTAARYIGEILINGNNKEIRAAEPWIKRAIQANTQNGMICNLGWDHILYSKFFAKTQRPQDARNCMEKAVEIFGKCGADGWADKLKNMKGKGHGKNL